MSEKGESSPGLRQALDARRAQLAQTAAEALVERQAREAALAQKLAADEALFRAGAEQARPYIAIVRGLAKETTDYLVAQNFQTYTFDKLVGYRGRKNNKPVYERHSIWPLRFNKLTISHSNEGWGRGVTYSDITEALGLDREARLHIAYGRGKQEYRVLSDEAIRFGPDKCEDAYATAIPGDSCLVDHPSQQEQRDTQGVVYLRDNAIVSAWREFFVAGIIGLERKEKFGAWPTI